MAEGTPPDIVAALQMLEMVFERLETQRPHLWTKEGEALVAELHEAMKRATDAIVGNLQDAGYALAAASAARMMADLIREFETIWADRPPLPPWMEDSREDT